MPRKKLEGVAKDAAAKAKLVKAGERSYAATARHNEIGDLPPPADPTARESFRHDLHGFLCHYFTTDNPMRPFSKDHVRAIKRLQNLIETGGRMALSVFRGWAKSWIFERSTIWAALYGHRVYMVVYAATAPLARASGDSIKAELFDNEKLGADFPESFIPFRRLEQKAQRAGQTQHGVPTGCRWLGDRVIYASVKTASGDMSEAAGAMIVFRGITGGTRGLKKGNVRPDCVFVDDPQTDKSARSEAGVQMLLGIITKGLLSLGTHFGRPLAICVIGSVIESNDLMERLLASPQWQGERIKMVAAWSNAHDTLWLGQYAAILMGYDRSDPDAEPVARQKATAFYLAHQVEMDAGCILTWDGCYGEGEASAVQHAYNEFIKLGPRVFAAEMQSEPLSADEMGYMLSAAKLAQKRSAWDRGVMPTSATVITAFVDVQGAFLPFAVCAWEPGFTGHVIEYGSFPRQSRSYYTLDTAFPTMEQYLVSHGRQELHGQGLDAIVAAGLDYALGEIMRRVYRKPDGAEHSIDQILVDTGWCDYLVFAAIHRLRQVGQTLSRVMPSKGFGTTATKAMPSFKRENGDVWGTGWGAAKPKPGEMRVATIDTNHCKSFLHQRFMAGINGRASLSLYRGEAGEHSMFADQMTDESPQLVTNKTNDRELVMWVQKPAANNHLLDCMVGCVAGASMRGIHLDGDPGKPPPPPPRHISDWYK
jgi:hypothetical protein